MACSGGWREIRASAALTIRNRTATAPYVLPPIRTLTVGPGIPPGQPADGFGRVADYHRRFGVSPTPEHVLLARTSLPCLVFRCDHGMTWPGPGSPGEPGPGQ